MLHGGRLVGEHAEFQSFRAARFHRVHDLRHIFVEVADDFSVAHFDGDHDGAARVDRSDVGPALQQSRMNSTRPTRA